MYTDKTLQQEIAELVNGRIAQDVAIGADAVTLQIICNHLDEFDRGKDFISHCAWHTTRKAAGDYLARKFRDETGDIRQRRLPGFEYVQRAYVVERDGDDVAVPTYQLSYLELTALASRQESEGKAKIAHGKELMDLRDRLYPDGVAV